MDRARLVSLSVSRRLGDVDKFYIKLHSACKQAKTVTVHAQVQNAAVDAYATNTSEVLTAQVSVPPMGEHWVEVPLHLTIPDNLYLENCVIFVWVDPAEDISWRIINGLNMYHRYGEQKPDGSWLTRTGKGYLIQRDTPKEVMANCGADNVNNGYNRIVDAENYEWVSDPEQSLPQWVGLTFAKPAQINSVSVVFDTDLAYPIVSWSGKNPTPGRLVKDYTVEVFDGTQWLAVAQGHDNIMRKCTHRFPAVTAEKVRITVQETWGDPSARIMEVRASLETK